LPLPSLPPSYLAPAVLIKVRGEVIEIPHHRLVILLAALDRGGGRDGADAGASAAEESSVLIDGGLHVLKEEGKEGGREGLNEKTYPIDGSTEKAKAVLVNIKRR